MTQHPHHSTSSRLPLLGSVVVAFSFAAHAADDPPTATPYRPSVSTPAQLSAPGWLEVEAGVQRTRSDDPQRRDTLPYALKLAFSPDWGVRVQGDAVVRERSADGSNLRGAGDTSVVLKRHFGIDDASAWGLEFGVKFPTARSGLGSGHRDAGLTGIYSSDFAPKWHVDINLSATRLGGVDAGESAWQKAWAAAVSRNLTDKWTAVGELSGTQRGGAGRTSQALAAASYSLTPGMVVDAGVSKGLSSASGGWSVFTGITFLAAKLF